MDYILSLTPQPVNFAPANLLEEISQNILAICTTSQFSVPMDREFGINTSFLDDPTSTARSKYSATLVRAVRKFEPRARITSIDFKSDMNGKICPIIKFRILDNS